jgi:coenzyme F420-0:L-glutamate ligase/coenzyme F420-1:gamma-L-glutamate ligase
VITATALAGLPEVRPGDDLAGLIAAALKEHPITGEEILVVAHKVVSKAEGRVRKLSAIEPGERARRLAGEHGKDPRHVQAVLDESRQVLRAARGVLICVTHHGFVCANAGVDASNVPGDDSLVLLPKDPDASARALRARLHEALRARLHEALRARLDEGLEQRPAILITDSFGRAWRHGQCDVAIGCAGLAPLEDWRGRRDAVGRELKATWIAVGDELAAAADLARTQDGLQPVVLVRGAERHVTADDGPGARALLRPEREDLFR